MSKTKTAKSRSRVSASPLMVRLDEDSKTVLGQAAELRGISISDYVRSITVTQARREVASSREGTITLSPDEQIEFWQALQAPTKLTPAQRRLGGLMRGDGRTRSRSRMASASTRCDAIIGGVALIPVSSK